MCLAGSTVYLFKSLKCHRFHRLESVSRKIKRKRTFFYYFLCPTEKLILLWLIRNDWNESQALNNSVMYYFKWNVKVEIFFIILSPDSTRFRIMSFVEFKQYVASIHRWQKQLIFLYALVMTGPEFLFFRPKLKYNLAIVDVGKLTFLKIIATVF